MPGKRQGLAQYLKASRESANLSQRDVANELGYRSAQFVSNWERGVSCPPVKALKRLGSLYSRPAEELYKVLLRDALERVEEDLHAEFYGRRGNNSRARR